MRLLVTILCLIPMMALADYPDPRRKQGQIHDFTDHLIHPPGMVVVTGSSSIRRWRSIDDDLAPTKIISTGIPGSNMNDLDYYLNELVLRYRPSAVVIYQGDNDSAIDSVSVDQVASKFKKIVTRIKKDLSNIFIYVMSVKPNIAGLPMRPKAVEINKRFAATANELDYLEYVDVTTPLLNADGLPRSDVFMEDGVHLNDKGYRIWTSILQPILATRP